MPYDAEQRRKRYLEKRDELIAYQLQYYRDNKEHREEFRARMRAYYRKAHPKRPTPIRYSKPKKPTRAEQKEIRDAPVLVPTTGLTLALVSRNKEIKPKFIYADASFSMTLE